MPCIQGHTHEWPDAGKLTIWSCEKFCAYCDPDMTHQYQQTSHLRAHVKNKHTQGGKLDKPNVFVEPGPMGNPQQHTFNPFRNNAARPNGVSPSVPAAVPGKRKTAAKGRKSAPAMTKTKIAPKPAKRAASLGSASVARPSKVVKRQPRQSGGPIIDMVNMPPRRSNEASSSSMRASSRSPSVAPSEGSPPVEYFDMTFRNNLRGLVDLAKAAGLSPERILQIVREQFHF